MNIIKSIKEDMEIKRTVKNTVKYLNEKENIKNIKIIESLKYSREYNKKVKLDKIRYKLMDLEFKIFQEEYKQHNSVNFESLLKQNRKYSKLLKKYDKLLKEIY